MKKRNRHAKTERAGVIAVEQACNDLDLIWRPILVEDVGLDGAIEISLGDFPTGKIVGAQIKAGQSYIRAENDATFRFYPDEDDLAYWLAVTIPVILFVHDPTSSRTYWLDVKKHVQERPPGVVYFEFPKSNVADRAFEAYLHATFDLRIFGDEEYTQAQTELSKIVYASGDAGGTVNVSALRLFVTGLWGLCSKLQFHTSIITDIIRRDVRDRQGDIRVNYTFSRDEIYAFLSRYFNTLTTYRLAELDVQDINHSMYAKLELPSFIAPLTVNGRRFVEFLRRSQGDVHDNQYLTLSLLPHVRLEFYDDFSIEGGSGHARLGRYRDVVRIRFNKHLDYYRIVHISRRTPDDDPIIVVDQTVFYYELRDYLSSQFGHIDRKHVILRYYDLPLSPLICWLETWSDQQPLPAESLLGKSNFEQAGFADEMQSILGALGSMTVSEPNLLMPDDNPFLVNGDILTIPWP